MFRNILIVMILAFVGMTVAVLAVHTVPTILGVLYLAEFVTFLLIGIAHEI